MSDTAAFFQAVAAGDDERVRALLEAHPALLRATDKQGKPLAAHALECGDRAIAALFTGSAEA